MLAMPGAVIGPGDHANLGVLQRLYVRGIAPALTIGGDYRRCRSTSTTAPKPSR